MLMNRIAAIRVKPVAGAPAFRHYTLAIRSELIDVFDGAPSSSDEIRPKQFKKKFLGGQPPKPLIGSSHIGGRRLDHSTLPFDVHDVMIIQLPGVRSSHACHVYQLSAGFIEHVPSDTVAIVDPSPGNVLEVTGAAA